MKSTLPSAVAAVLFAACASSPDRGEVVGLDDVTPAILAGTPVAALPNEPRLRNVRQLTFEGENAEAYWSNDGTKLVLQRRTQGMAADQIYVIDLASGQMQQVSTGTGRTTCSYFLQGDQQIVFASTHHFGDAPPVVKRTRQGYLWDIHREYDLFVVDVDGKNLRQLTKEPGYDAEATVCPKTGDLVFTSVRDGDLELYICKADGSNVQRVTNRPGYDGGAFFSHDGTKLVLRSAYPRDDKQASEDQELLGQQLVRPSNMEITVCNRDGSGFRKVTNNGAANFAPFWLPGDKRIIFSSNFRGMEKMKQTGDHTQARNFELFVMDEDGGNVEQVTDNPEFDGFPMFSPCGRYLVFASNRYGKKQGDTNVFVAEWVK
jgi:Tol biopolymer transport system component